MSSNCSHSSSKRYLYWVLPVACLLCSHLSPSSVRAGGFVLHGARVNGLGSSATVEPSQTTTLCFRKEGYFYSGHGDEYAHILFAVMPAIEIRASVGRGGANHQDDVERITKALIDARLLKVDTPTDDINAISLAIETYQRRLGLGHPDGRIDPNGRTIQALRFEATDKLVVYLHEHRQQGDVSRPSDYSLSNCVRFNAPAQPGTYTIMYQRFPFITQYPLATDVLNELAGTHQEYVRNTIRSESYRRWCQLATITVTLGQKKKTRDVATYLRINEKFPGVVENIRPGNSPVPVTFSWYTKPDYDDVEFSYRLYPDQPEFSNWSKHRGIDYFFIGPGSHSFEVRSRYPDDRGEHLVLPVADYSFFLEAPFISKPVIYKASGDHIDTYEEVPDFRSLYARSKALLIGVSRFEKMSLLPYVDRDISRMESVLRRHGFEVTKVLGEKTRDDIMSAIEDFLAGLQANDRVIIYFSTHGFQDKVIKSKAYIAPCDCDPDRPGINCIELGDLERRLEQAMARSVKHLLVVLDACSSGLGVVTKSPEYKELTIAVEPGAHMITAGMVNQKAEMDNVEQISTFTRYLAEGLDGAADYTDDQVVSLTELLLYVRYEVARKTNGAQTPMVGRLEGSGEMIFQVGR